MDTGSAVDNLFKTLAQMLLTGSTITYPPSP